MLRKLLTKIGSGQNYIVDNTEVREVTLDNIYRIFVDDVESIGYRHNGYCYSCNVKDMLDKETAERYAKDRQAKAKAKRVADLKAQMNRIIEELKELLQ